MIQLTDKDALRLRADAIALERLARVARQRLGNAARANGSSEDLVLQLIESQRMRIVELERAARRSGEIATLGAPAAEY